MARSGGAAAALGLAVVALGWPAASAEVAGSTATVASASQREDVVTTFADPDITEASGLAVLGERWATVNDSGDSARVFLVDPATGRTDRTIPFAAEARDVEALAPAPDASAVWVGDIGDNRAVRPQVRVHHVSVTGSDRRSTLTLNLPGGPADAEALLAHPSTGELVLVTKGILGGEFLAVPDRARRDVASGQDRSTRARTLPGRAPSLVTDGAFLADGRHLVLRNYGTAFLYSWPALERIGSFPLPAQQQGEAIAVDGDGSLLLASEGLHAPVLRVRMPSTLGRTAQDRPSAPTSAAAEPSRATPAEDQVESRRWGPVAWVSVAVLVVGVLSLGALGRHRRR